MNETAAVNLARLRAVSATLGLRLTDAQCALFAAYAARIVAANATMNLTAITDPDAMAVRHFADSLAVAVVWTPRPGATIADVGSGAGLPGLALKILWPATRLTIIESIGKKAAFVAETARALDLAGVSVVTARAEEIAHQAAHRERYDLVTARAVARLPTLAELTLPLCAIGGRVVAHKSAAVEAELAAGRRAIALLGGGDPTVTTPPAPELADHRLVAIPKIGPTPTAYPRRAGVPAKRPLV
ncbi:MAG: 16S rRNA (guanine(527)-N(7))-methyltransferase RsmG [Dehalococcoidia bacterium]|nr:16S rRNA (guanine(527)-N(7))-methyltransferase RsmG [Dehalococcoidia bacterium]